MPLGLLEVVGQGVEEPAVAAADLRPRPARARRARRALRARAAAKAGTSCACSGRRWSADDAGDGHRRLDGVEPVHRRRLSGSRRRPKPRASGSRPTPLARKSASSATITSAFSTPVARATGRGRSTPSSPARCACGAAGSYWCQVAAGELLQERPDLPGEGRRGDRLGEHPEPLRARPLRLVVGPERRGRRSRPAGSRRTCRSRRRASRPASGRGRRGRAALAWVKQSIAPRLSGWSAFPSTIVGRPMWVSATTPVPTPPSETAVA